MALLPKIYRTNSVVFHNCQYCLLFNCIVNVHFVYISMNIPYIIVKWRAMAQAVGRRPLTAETWGQLQASPLVICGGKSCTGHFI